MTLALTHCQHVYSRYYGSDAQGQSGLEAKILASASKLWPRPRGFGLGLALMLLSYYVIGHFSYKNCVKFRNFVNFSSNNLKSNVVNHYLVLFS